VDVSKLQRLKSRATQLMVEHEAILTLTNLHASDFGSNFRLAKEQLSAANSVTKLVRWIELQRDTIAGLRRSLGITVRNSENLLR
jgi:hypothetical protein